MFTMKNLTDFRKTVETGVDPPLALLRNIQNIRICMRKKPIVSVTYENERILIKNR